jgi:anti-sigma regulatory factor (Ser/Thr protein kinase)
MRRSYSAGCTWRLGSLADLVGVARRAREVARSLGWGTADTAALSLAVLELSSNAVRHGGGGLCRLEAGPDGADVIVEDRGAGFPSWALCGWLEETRGLRAVRALTSQLVLENIPGGGGRARAALLATRAARRPQRPITALAG